MLIILHVVAGGRSFDGYFVKFYPASLRSKGNFVNNIPIGNPHFSHKSDRTTIESWWIRVLVK